MKMVHLLSMLEETIRLSSEVASLTCSALVAIPLGEPLFPHPLLRRSSMSLIHLLRLSGMMVSVWKPDVRFLNLLKISVRQPEAQ